MEHSESKVREIAPIGKSDHVGIVWRFMAGMEAEAETLDKLDYWNGDYSSMNRYLQNIPWSQEFERKNIEDS